MSRVFECKKQAHRLYAQGVNLSTTVQGNERFILATPDDAMYVPRNFSMTNEREAYKFRCYVKNSSIEIEVFGIDE